MRILGLITARGGSKGLPGKNVRPLAGKPLLCWTIDAARACGEIDRLVISTDDPAIAEVARHSGCEVPFMRPPALARDETPAIDVAVHALDQLGPCDLLVLLQPTSPLRSPADISACIQACRDRGAPGCIAITRATESPYWMFNRLPAGELISVVPAMQAHARRQDLPAAFLINGAVYAARPDWLRLHRTFMGPGVHGHEMPPERSIDIDTLADFKLAEAQVTRRVP